MREFLDNSRLILTNIKELRKTVEEMKECIRMKHTSVLTEDKEMELDERMERLDAEFDKMCYLIKEAIKTTKKETSRLEKNEEISKEEVEMRNVHTYKYYKELSDAIYSYRNLKSDYKNKEKDLLKQAYQIVNPKATEGEIEKIVETEGDGQLGTAFSLGTASGQNMLKQAKYRRKKIDGIVESISKLVALIDEIDKMVNKEDKEIDQIVVHVTTAEMNTKQANKELESALAYQRKLNTLKRTVLVIFVILVIILLFFFISKNGTTNVYTGKNQNF